MEIKNSHLITAIIVLTFLFLLSFLNFNSERRTVLKTALINPKYRNEITEIQLSKNQDLVVLEKKNDFWFIKNPSQNNFSAPAEAETVEKLINELIKVRKMYKISDQIPKNNRFGFEKESQFYIKCSYSAGFSEFYFGNTDFSEVFRYLMTGKNTKVYQLDSSLEPYLTALQSFWTEKTIISKKIIKIDSEKDIQTVTVNGRKFSSSDSSFASYVQSLLELRHGGLLFTDKKTAETILSGKYEAEIFLEFGNKTSVSLKAYKLPVESGFIENEYALFVSYDNQKVKSLFKISAWTLLKLLNKN
jgi:hypothetical protein